MQSTPPFADQFTNDSVQGYSQETSLAPAASALLVSTTPRVGSSTQRNFQQATRSGHQIYPPAAVALAARPSGPHCRPLPPPRRRPCPRAGGARRCGRAGGARRPPGLAAARRRGGAPARRRCRACWPGAPCRGARRPACLPCTSIAPRPSCAGACRHGGGSSQPRLSACAASALWQGLGPPASDFNRAAGLSPNCSACTSEPAAARSPLQSKAWPPQYRLLQRALPAQLLTQVLLPLEPRRLTSSSC